MRDDIEILRMGGVIKDAPEAVIKDEPEAVQSENSPTPDSKPVETDIPAVENAKDEL